ncbi:alpha/beta fold hydrolase [Luteimonas sp. MC1895]|uniref:alpha/beta hydrolase family protein n=1 Tax=Luteimonas sp. MC1895 TaxID=2819513 RepID=UPI001F2143CD|nr:alpha/beta fold hydrolase [Luteimonas sp. MC1895]
MSGPAGAATGAMAGDRGYSRSYRASAASNHGREVASHAQSTMAIEASDGHRFELLTRIPERPRRSLLWLPALGVAARHYLPVADALAARGVAVFLHEWRGHGSSSLRAGRDCDWGYRELLTLDLPASEAAIAAATPGLPRIAGGHSLGGQLAACRLGLDPAACDALWLAGSGAPYWRAFPRPQRLVLPLAYRALPWLAARAGSLPGRRIGFGGNEARGVMHDWAGTALSGRYATGSLGDLEPRMATAAVELRTVLFARDWLAPATSLQHLASRFPRARIAGTVLDDAALGVRADHFAWMKSPVPVAAWFQPL